MRELVDATIRTTVDDDEVRAAQAEIEAITARLRRDQLPGAYGVRFAEGKRGRPWGNAVVGVRNAVAPPLVIERHPDENGEVWSDFHLGAAYEGPPDHVHGGVLALVLDQLLGESAGAGGRPGMTGTLTLRYRRPTPLGDLRTEAWIDLRGPQDLGEGPHHRSRGRHRGGGGRLHPPPLGPRDPGQPRPRRRRPSYSNDRPRRIVPDVDQHLDDGNVDLRQGRRCPFGALSRP